MKRATSTTCLLAALAAAPLAACASGPKCDLDSSLDADQCAALHAMALPATLPTSPGNAKADDDDAAYLGFEIFFDARFSSNENVRCATCHDPENYFDDAKATSKGLETVTRNSPTTFDAARMVSVVFWDGRADSLWSQPLFALENPKEMNFTRLEIVHRLQETFSKDYAAAFGPLPDFSDMARFPAKGAPGQASWDSMKPADQESVNRAVASLGKAFEAYERKISTGPSPFDQYLAGDDQAMSDAAKRGMVDFVTMGCAGCHSGPLMSDEKFHNLGVPALAGQPPDRGRIDAISILEDNPFNLGGPYADGSPAYTPPTSSPSDLGAFRTPSLRNVALSAPYGHNGRFATLADVVRFHLQGGGRGQSGYVGDVDAALVAGDASDATVNDIVAFLGTLNGEYPLPPWNNWPGKN